MKIAFTKVHPDVVRSVRSIIDTPDKAQHPIYNVSRALGTGKATCRACEQPIGENERTILFWHAPFEPDHEHHYRRTRMVIHEDNCSKSNSSVKCPVCKESIPENAWVKHWDNHEIATGWKLIKPAAVSVCAKHLEAHCGQCEEDRKLEEPKYDERTQKILRKKKKKKVSNISKRKLNIPVSDTLNKIFSQIQENGSKGLIVGGAVRDALAGKESKDVDVEVYGTNYDNLSKILAPHGKVDLVGKSFGVIKFTDPEGKSYDFSLPRKDSKNGVGHKDFDVEVNSDLTPKEAASRRDFTINSMAYDPLSEELHDYFGGEKDLKDKVLRHTSSAFAEDPLRVLRGMQFASRFDLDVHPETAELSKSISHEFSTIPKERVTEEFMKLATKGSKPGKAIDYLKKTGWSENFPELHALHGVPQDSEWHPEGDVASHTAHAMNAAAQIADREGLEDDDRATIVLGAMAHDLGKVTHTQTDGERITSHGHDQAGGPIAHKLLTNIGIKPSIISRVVPIVENHMSHLNFDETSKPKSVRRLASRIHPASVRDLSLVMEADHSGRPPLEGGMPEGAKHILRLAEESDVTHGQMKPFIQGKHVMPFFNHESGPHIGEVVKDAYQAQLNGEINTHEEAHNWLQNRMSPQTVTASSNEWRHTEEDGFEMWETKEDPNNFAIIENDNKYDLYILKGSYDSPEEAKSAADSMTKIAQDGGGGGGASGDGGSGGGDGGSSSGGDSSGSASTGGMSTSGESADSSDNESSESDITNQDNDEDPRPPSEKTNCPKCKGPLTPIQVGGLATYTCGNCGFTKRHRRKKNQFSSSWIDNLSNIDELTSVSEPENVELEITPRIPPSLMEPEETAQSRPKPAFDLFASRTVVCARCKKTYRSNKKGHFTGFCETCREQLGMVNHKWDSEDTRRGHDG